MALVDRAFRLFEFVPGVGEFFAVFLQGPGVEYASWVDPAVFSTGSGNGGRVVHVL